jgi:uncharacterized repeat protein (TIGR01451 family)
VDWLEERVVLQATIFGGFQIDGDLQASAWTPPPPATGTYDWDNLNPVTSFALPKIDTVQNDAFNSSTDDQFGSGQKESQAMLSVTTGTSPSKADLARMYVGHSVAPGAAGPNDVYLFLGFNKFTSTGNTFAGFELNQSMATYNAGTAAKPYLLPLRTAGDLLVTYNFSSSTASIGLLEWSGTSTSGSWVNPTTKAVGVPEDLTGSGLGFGAVNAGPVNNPFSGTSNPYGVSKPFSDGSNPTTFAAGTFGEAAIDLTAALPVGSSSTFNWVYMSTRSSSSYTSNLEDIVKPFQIVIPLKGDIRGNVFNDVNADGVQNTGELGLQNWQVQLLDSTGTTLVTGITNPATTDASGNYDFTGLSPGTYQVREVLQGTYQQTAPTPSTTFPPGEPVTVVATPPGLVATNGPYGYSAQVLAGFVDTGLNFGDRLPASLSLTKSDDTTTGPNDTVTAGDGNTYTYTITVQNSGQTAAQGVSVVDTWPAGITQVTIGTPSLGSVGTPDASGNFTWTVGTLAGGQSTTLTVTYKVPASFTASNFTNTAELKSTTPVADITASDTTEVATSADLSVKKDDGVTKVTAGDGKTYTYTITVTNNGPSDAQNAQVADTWPAGITQVTIGTPTAGSVGSPDANSNFTWTVGTLASGGSATLTVTYKVPASFSGTSYTNTATVSSDTQDPISGNNSSADTDAVGNLTVTVPDPGAINEGDSVLLTGTVSNPENGARQVVIDWADAAPGVDTKTFTLDAGTTTFNVAHQYVEEGIYHVTVTASITGSATATATPTVTVNDVVPKVSKIGDIKVDEGTLIQRTVSFTDPAPNDTWTYTVNWGDGTTDGPTAAPASQSFPISHTYGDDGTYPVLVTVKDDEGVAGTSSFTATVNNVPPLLSALSNLVENTGTAFSVTPTFSDPGFSTAITFTYSIDWGDSTSTGTLPVANVTYGSPGALTTGSFTGSHSYTSAGKYKVTATATDDDGGSDSSTFFVTVANLSGAAAPSPATTVSVTSTSLAPLTTTAPSAPAVHSQGSSPSIPAIAWLGSLTDVVPDELAAEMAQLPLTKALKLRHS